MAGILISRFGRSTSACRRAASAIVPSVSWARFGSTSSETQPSLPLPSSHTGRRTSQAFADVVARERDEDLLRLGLGGRELADLVVVRVALGDRALEDRGVGGHADDAVANEAGEVALVDELARQVVDPDALALLGELLQGGHAGSPGVGGAGGAPNQTVPDPGRRETPVHRGSRQSAGPGASAGARPVRAARRLRPAHHGAPRAGAPPVPGWR